MEHNPGLTEDQDVQNYMKRDLIGKSKQLFKIIRDEKVGRYVLKNVNIDGSKLSRAYRHFSGTWWQRKTSKPAKLFSKRPL